MSWSKTTYYCEGKTVRGTRCHSERPYPGLYCWHHRDQRDAQPSAKVELPSPPDIYYCEGTTDDGSLCVITRPGPGLYCLAHRDQNPDNAELTKLVVQPEQVPVLITAPEELAGLASTYASIANTFPPHSLGRKLNLEEASKYYALAASRIQV